MENKLNMKILGYMGRNRIITSKYNERLHIKFFFDYIPFCSSAAQPPKRSFS